MEHVLIMIRKRRISGNKTCTRVMSTVREGTEYVERMLRGFGSMIQIWNCNAKRCNAKQQHVTVTEGALTISYFCIGCNHWTMLLSEG